MRSRGASLAFLTAAIFAAIPAAAANLVSHRALYDMTLGAVSSRSGIIDAQGNVYLEVEESCEGWTLEQRFRLNVVYADGPETKITSSYSAWESRDGSHFVYVVRNLRDGQLSEELRGRATLEGEGGGGMAEFTRPREVEMELPPGTLFPTAHTRALIDEATAGKTRVSRVLFDGTSLEGPFEVNAVILPATQEAEAPEGAAKLVERPSWLMRMAFFPLESAVEEPSYEVGAHYHDNGVAGSMTIDYGDFAVKVRLYRIEETQRPDC